MDRKGPPQGRDHGPPVGAHPQILDKASNQIFCLLFPATIHHLLDDIQFFGVRPRTLGFGDFPKHVVDKLDRQGLGLEDGLLGGAAVLGYVTDVPVLLVFLPQGPPVDPRALDQSL